MATGAGFATVINENATLITIGLTVVGLIMAFTFHWIGMKQKDRLTEDWKDRERKKIRQEIEDENTKE